MQTAQWIGIKGHPITYTFIQNQGDKHSLCFMFPGRGYTNHHPLLYFATKILLQAQIDVIQVQYPYHQMAEFQSLDLEKQHEWLSQDMNGLVQTILDQHPYEEIIFLGKSLGTVPILHTHSKLNSYETAKYILLTPLIHLEPLYQQMLQMEQKTLCVIGDKDPVYDLTKMNAIRTKPNIQVLVIENGDHSLEIPTDIKQSILILKQIMNQIQLFIED
ncbi:alpha/beta family hydrolase [Thermoflavimicrobium dichotomicum]|uniref:KANL3/Tex30 alpha/beta hydrolase-like domain-containing protein n=1 Tax=Thermoflavimicrobium dichotomicum TaxID=46223 RepID=A0A1I3NNK1_9BACL|nr:alpha/beta family hydrolase [Thermoflavimicrobium dichotomicum]SFJ10825.1 hypothetical protein SAMN05421852_104214 [Thermoflavimicrobium dichotomicum]